MILTLIILFNFSAAWSRCGDFSEAAQYLNTQRFVQASRQSRSSGAGELTVNLRDVSQAKSLAFRFPAFENLGFGLPGRLWRPYNSRLERSSLFGKRVGWEINNDNGHARIRLDWDPQKGAHYNIEITQRSVAGGRSETHKMAVGFQCQNRPCTERQVLRMVERMQ